MDESIARDLLISDLEREGFSDTRVLNAMGRVARHALLPHPVRPGIAYANQPLPIGAGQTISQPLVVAMMTSLARVEQGQRVLDVGTGSGYQAAVLAELGALVFSLERLSELAARARMKLDALGYTDKIRIRIADGHFGWPEEAPFDAIVVSAAASRIPSALIEQLALPGRLVIPVGVEEQVLKLVERTDSGISERSISSVRFVPLVPGANSPEGETST